MADSSENESCCCRFFCCCCCCCRRKKKPVELPENIHNAFMEWEQKNTEPTSSAVKGEKMPNQEVAAVALKEQLQMYEEEVNREEDTVYDRDAIKEPKQHKKKKKTKKRKKPLRALDDKLPYQRQSLSSSFELSGESLDSLSSPAGPPDKQNGKTPGKKTKKKKKFKTKGAKGTAADLMSLEGVEECFVNMPDIVKEILEDAKETEGGSVEQAAKLSGYGPAEVANLSRSKEREFAALLKANTKKMLFSSQPTADEVEKWMAGQTRPGPKIQIKPGTTRIKLNPVVDYREFCYLCTPRHWRSECKVPAGGGDMHDAQQET